MYKKVIIAIDLSDQADAILAKAKILIGTLGAEYWVVFAYEQPIYPWGEMAMTMPVIDFDELKANLQKQLKSTVSKAGLDPSRAIVSDGLVAESIIDRALHLDADLIVIGNHSAKGVRRLLGSTANRVLHHANCDVLALRVDE